MIAIDPIIFEFLQGNTYACLTLLALLKGIAKITKSTTDDKVMTLIGNVFGAIPLKGKKKPE